MRVKQVLAAALTAVILLPGTGGAQAINGAVVGADLNGLTRLGQQSRGVLDIGGQGISPGLGRGGLIIKLDEALYDEKARPGISGPRIWTGGDITQFDADDGREGAVGGITAGVSFSVNPRFSGTVFGSFRHDEFESFATGLDTETDMFGGGIMVDYLAPGDIRAQAVLRVGFGEGETRLGTVVSDFDQRELEVGLKLDRRFGFDGGFYADPAIEISYQLADRDDYVFGGAQIPGEVTDTAALRLGGAVGQTSRFGGALRRLDWELRGSAVLSFLGDTPAFALVQEDATEFGGTVGGTLRFTFDNAVAIGVNADYLHLGGDLNAVSAGLDLEVPLN
ncbi:MAG: autotransporter domain-containing protein [Pseudomonadota bacterium]